MPEEKAMKRLSKNKNDKQLKLYDYKWKLLQCWQQFLRPFHHFKCSVSVRGEALDPKKKEICSYVVTIETTCTKKAGTTNHVSLRFGDMNSNDVLIHPLNPTLARWVDPLNPKVLDDVPRTPFQACAVDRFQVDGPCVDSPVCYLYLKLSGSDDWQPGFVQVRVLDKYLLNSDYFYFRRYIPRHVWHGFDLCDREVSPFGVRH